MRRIFLAGLFLASTALCFQTSAHPGHHVKHGMVLVGENEIFASHIVYKVPHHYQVILKVQLNDDAKTAYLQERKNHPTDDLVLLLDEMAMGQIRSMDSISGTFLREDSSGNRVPFGGRIVLSKAEFSVLFFNELPLSLE